MSLSLSDRYLASILTHAHEAIVAMDPRGEIRAWNRAAEQLFGYPESEAIGRLIDDLATPPWADELPRLIAEVRLGEPVVQREMLFRRGDGRTVVVELTLAPVLDEAGGQIGISAWARDLSNVRAAERRRLAELAVTRTLSESRSVDQALPVLLESLGQTLDWEGGAFWRVDARAGVIRRAAVWHRAPERRSAIEARSPATLEPGVGLAGRIWKKGEPIWNPDLASDPELPGREEGGAAGLGTAFGFPILVGREVLGVIELFRATRRSIDRNLRRVAFSIGSQIGQFFERKFAEEALLESEEWLATTLRSIGDGVIATDRDDCVTFMNPIAESMTGWSEAEAVGKPLTEVFRLIDEEAREAVSSPAAHVVRSGATLSLAPRTLLLSRDGTEHPVDDSCAPIRDEKGRIRGVVLVFRDVTERRRAEEERAALLERSQAARAEAESSSRAKDEFLATLSHELRTPLTAILGWTRLLRSRSLDEAVAARALEIVERNAQAQAQLINDLLDVSRIITGKLRLELHPLDLERVLEAAVDSARPAAEAKEIRLEVSIDPRAGLVAGDTSRLQQVFWNLLSNAIRFTPRGGNVRVVLVRAGPDAEVSVIDSGQGIRPEFLPHIFERFRQADSTTARQHGGLGLGLAIVRHLVELHGGTVKAESSGDGGGAAFAVRLPLSSRASVPGPAAAGESGGRRDPPDLGGVRVLLVDDSADARELFTTVLRRCGAEVRPAASAAEALELLAEWRPDVLVSDIAMPEEDGCFLIRRVQSRMPREETPIPAPALTAYARVEERLRALSAGYQMHLAKPIEPEELAAAIAALASGDVR